MDPLNCTEIWGGNRPVDTAIAMPGLDGWLCSMPYRKGRAGGDVYYLSSCSDGALTRAGVADVSGHGISVADAAEQLRDMMRKHIETYDHGEVLRELNEQFGANDQEGLFATAALLSYYRESGHMLYSLAGHPEPLHFSRATGEWRFLPADDSCDIQGIPNLPLGILGGTKYCPTYVELAVGDVLVLYSDGIIEAHNPVGRELGMQGLLGIVRGAISASASETASNIRDGVSSFRDSTPPSDDVTLIVLQRNR